MQGFMILAVIHSRYMKTQHIKFEILNERMSVFKCNLIQLNFVQNIPVIGRICDTNFHPFGDVKKFRCLPPVSLEINRIETFAI